MIDKYFKTFGMELHIRQNKTDSKTECMYIPDIPLPIHNEPDATSQVIVKPPTASEIQEAFGIHRSLKYQTCL